MSTPEKEIVIASYREPLDWIAEIPDDWKVSVYNADENNRKFPANVNAIKVVPNIGREANQWIYHIVTRYDSLAAFTLFLQADKFHHPGIIDRLMHAEVLPLHPFRYIGSEMDAYSFPMPLLPPTIDLLKNAWLDDPIPPPRPFQVGAQFYISRETILNRPLAHYERLLDAIRTPSAWSPAHLLEPAWGSVFEIK